MTSPSAQEPAPDPAAGIDSLERFLAAENERAQARKRLDASDLTESERVRARLAQQKATHEERERVRRRCIKVALLLGSFSAALTLCLILWIVQ
ncbi:hypothetical protein AB0D83_28230 [Streptomyces decoyicus]|uniref:hypothetical protein n=1 Tax=Streptomyces decoyicus TaxID=249567 RepID=UPI00341092B5